MSSVPVAPHVLGAQLPRVSSVPDCAASYGEEAVEVASAAGLDLDPWQQHVLVNSLGERADGKWAAFEVGVEVPRQNGKGGLLEARELAGLFLLGEKLITHSAHQFDTSLEAFRRLLMLIEDTPDFDQEVKRVSRSHGEEGIELKSGQRIRFRTRTKGGGRGFSGDCLILDEAMILPESAHGALLPTLSARPNPQVWYTGSAVDQEIHEHGVVFARVRERGHAGDESLAWFEWSADGELEDAEALAMDVEAWRQSNPGLGIRISLDYIAKEQRSLGGRTFAVERLGIGDWPSTDDADDQVIDFATWRSRSDATSAAGDPVCFAVDVKPDRSWASIGVAGRRRDRKAHLALLDRRPGTGWVADRMQELVRDHKHVGVICDGVGPAASLAAALAKVGIEVTTTNTRELGQACGMLFDAVDQDTFCYLPSEALDAAVKCAGRAPLGDAWKWSRKASAGDISPLVTVTLALWGLETFKPLGKPAVINLAEV